jgi:hypothetical protein
VWRGLLIRSPLFLGRLHGRCSAQGGAGDEKAWTLPDVSRLGSGGCKETVLVIRMQHVTWPLRDPHAGDADTSGVTDLHVLAPLDVMGPATGLGNNGESEEWHIHLT